MPLHVVVQVLSGIIGIVFQSVPNNNVVDLFQDVGKTPEPAHEICCLRGMALSALSIHLLLLWTT